LAAAEKRRLDAQAAAAAAETARQHKAHTEKLARIQPEPAVDSPQAVAISVRLRDGRRCARRFQSEQPLQAVCDWLDVSESASMPARYALASAFPRRVFEASEYGKSLAELGLKREALNVIALDE
jgi:hypothetical protein